MQLGDEARMFTLPDTDGQQHEFPDDSPTVVVFTCNHCPYALAWHDRLLQVARDYPQVRFLAVNPNDAERYPADSFEAMKERVQTDGGWPMPYLHDASQEVARAYGARTTPDLFVLDGRTLRYRGAPDANYREESENAAWLREALDAVLAGEEPARPETEPVGCSVKWR
jgi:thiol-disulfide isomerase/thioredoxin